MLFEIAADQLPNGRRLAGFIPHRHWIAALVDLALEPLGLFPGSGDRPIRPCADGQAALPRLDPIGKDEGARAAAGDADAEADHLLVIDDDVLLLRLKPFHAAFGEMRLHAFDPFRATQPRSFPVSKMLSAGLLMNGGNGRKPGGKRGGAEAAEHSPGGAVSCPHCVRRLPGFERRFAHCSAAECAFCSECSGPEHVRFVFLSRAPTGKNPE